MIQASTLGIIDFSQAKFYEPKWRRRLRLALIGLERLNNQRHSDLTARHYAAVLSAPNIEADNWKEVQDKAVEAVYDHQFAFDPSQYKTKEERERAAVRRDIDRWQRRFGDLHSPEVQDRIKRTADALRRLKEQTAAEEARSMEAIIGISRRERSRANARSSHRRR